MEPTVIEVHDADFEREVLERSLRVPVVVDFWAAWCAPCRALGPVLEKLAGEADGDWVLAKLDVDSNPAAAQAFRIQGIPAVKAFRDGRMVAEFTGALPEQQVRTWLQQLGPDPADEAVARGDDALKADDVETAEREYRTALDLSPTHEEAKAKLGRIELSRRADAIDDDELQARLAADPADVDAAIPLADARADAGSFGEAFEILLDAVTAAAPDERERARKHLVQLLNLLPADDPRALSARRSLSRVLF